MCEHEANKVNTAMQLAARCIKHYYCCTHNKSRQKNVPALLNGLMEGGVYIIV
jgi:hypothetical protein